MAADDIPLSLEEIPLFQDLPPDQLVYISGYLHRRSVPAGVALMMAEEPGEVAYLILSGTVKIRADRADGTEVIVALRGRGEIVGEMSLIDRRSRSASVVTQEECTLLWWDRASFETCLRTMPALTFNLARILARRLRLATAQIQALAALDIQGRVARQILTFAEEYGMPIEHDAIAIPIRLTQNDLAGLIGAARTRVNTAMVGFKRRGYIVVDERHHITVLDPAGLARRCD